MNTSNVPDSIGSGKPDIPNLDRISYYLSLLDNGLTPLRQLESVLELSRDQPITLDVARAIIEKLIFSGGLDYLDIQPDAVADLIALLTWYALGEDVDDD